MRPTPFLVARFPAAALLPASLSPPPPTFLSHGMEGKGEAAPSAPSAPRVSTPLTPRHRGESTYTAASRRRLRFFSAPGVRGQQWPAPRKRRHFSPVPPPQSPGRTAGRALSTFFPLPPNSVLPHWQPLRQPPSRRNRESRMHARPTVCKMVYRAGGMQTDKKVFKRTVIDQNTE